MAHVHMGVSLNGGTPQSPPQVLIIFRTGKPHGFVGSMYNYTRGPLASWMFPDPSSGSALVFLEHGLFPFVCCPWKNVEAAGMIFFQDDLYRSS